MTRTAKSGAAEGAPAARAAGAAGAAGAAPAAPRIFAKSMKPHFSRWFAAAPARLHFAAHSHHPWPDVSFDAQDEAWRDAATLADFKWDKIFGEVIPAAQRHVARVLSLSDASTVAIAPSTHELVMRAVSALEGKGLAGGAPLRVLTTDGEFHSWVRQLARLEEAGLAFVERVPVEPFATFADRFVERVRRAVPAPDVVYVSHVFYNSGFVFEDVTAAVDAAAEAAPDALFFVDGYHSFMALPVDWSALEGRAFYTAGGYKYAMAGEGVCFLHCPPGRAARPVHTGWFSGFGDLTKGVAPGVVPFPADALRMWGATYDPVALYRFNAVQDLWKREGVSVADLHAHARALQERFLDGLAAAGGGERGAAANGGAARGGAAAAVGGGASRSAAGGAGLRSLSPSDLLPPRGAASDRGNFLTFRTPHAGEIYAALRADGVVTDYRKDRLRFGFGAATGPEDVDAILARS